jgi:hypothetical protein
MSSSSIRTAVVTCRYERNGITIERQILLIEIERDVHFECNERVFVGLTKKKLLNTWFEAQCERWNEDRLNEPMSLTAGRNQSEATH